MTWLWMIQFGLLAAILAGILWLIVSPEKKLERKKKAAVDAWLKSAREQR